MAEPTAEDSGSGYSPLLAQMMKIDPAKMGSVSLSALGRQAIGTDSPEYIKAKADVDSAREQMESALTARKGGMDMSMLALAQGFLAPTRTGSFGESLGTALGGYGAAQQAEDKRLQEMAKMKYELARAGLSDEQAAAQLGLSVVSKLTPPLTAIQKQVLSEGLDTRTPAGIARIKELQGLTNATPEMKAFASRLGIPVTDPTFAAKFDAFEKTKGLNDIATRLNLDLTKPTDLKLAQQEAQRDNIRKDNPDVAKALASFGGDALNPSDMQRAQGIVATNIRLEQQSKTSTMAMQEAQTKRTKQEIDEHIRNNDASAVTTKAQELGVPLIPNNRYAGLNSVEAANRRNKDFDNSSAYIEKNVAPILANVDGDIANLERAKQLNKELTTGRYLYSAPLGIAGAAKAMSGDRAKFQDFDSLAQKSASLNRIPGDHNISNFDVQNMLKTTFSSDKEPKANAIIIDSLLAQKKRDKDLNQYLSDYAAVNGNIGPHALTEWHKYMDANPILAKVKDPQSGRETVQLNPKRMTYQEYFNAPRVKVDASGREIAQ